MTVQQQRLPIRKKKILTHTKENVQMAFQEAIQNPQTSITSICKKYQINRDYFYKEIKTLPNYSEYQKTQVTGIKKTRSEQMELIKNNSETEN
jgi:aspartate/methionine/tyrosine aminotransferase